MPAAREQAEERRLDGLGQQVKRGDVAVEVIDRDQRQPVRPGEGLRRREADEQRADEARALRDGYGIEALEFCARFRQCLPQHRDDELEVAPRGDLRNDTAEASVQLRLRRDDVRENLALVRDDRRSRLVTRSLERQDHCPNKPHRGSDPRRGGS